jgi:hypothetical protein
MVMSFDDSPRVYVVAHSVEIVYSSDISRLML